MENKSLRKRLYQNLSQRPLKHTFLLQSQMKDPKSPQGILRPKILQQSVGELKNMSNSFVASSPSLLKSAQFTDAKIKPKKVEVQKLSKEAKSMIEDGKNKIKANLKPHEIFAFYDAFPEMIEDFFYLNRTSHPYDYQIVSYAKRNHHQYMTISSQGVTLYHDKQAEFLTRQQWIEDEKIYHQLQKIDFFSQYKLSKNFIIWKNKMKRHYMKSMSNVLSQKLFLTYEFPRKCLKQIRQISLNLQDSLAFLPCEQVQTLTWQQLLDTTNKYHSRSLIHKIEQNEKRIVKSLEHAIQLQIKNFKENNKIKIEGLNSKQENKEGYIYSQEAILRKQYKRVLKLIKLAESILLQSKIQLFKRWLLQILDKLRQVNENSLRDEWISISFIAIPPSKNSTDIVWNPTQDSFINTFKLIIEKTVNYVCHKHQKIMNNPIFEKYRNSEDQVFNKEDRHNSLKNLIQQSKFYSDITWEIRTRLQKQYEHVINQEKELKKYIEIFIKHQNMCPLQVLIKESSVAEISLYVQEWKEDNNQMQDLPDKCFGMVKFDYSQIRKSMMSVAHNSFSQLFALLPKHLAHMCQQTERKTNQVLKPIDTIPNDQNFVEFTKAVKHASEQLDQIKNQGKQIKKLQNLLNENKIPNLQIHRNNIRILEKSIQQLAKKVNQTETKQDQRLTKFKKSIEQKIKKIKLTVKQYCSKLQQIQVQQKCLSSETIIERISIILPIIADLDRQATNISSIECELSLNYTDFSQAHNLYNRARQINSLWKQKRLWIQFNQELQKTHYEQLDFEKQMQKWTEFNNQILKISEFLQHNQFLNQLSNEINQAESLMQLAKSLQSKSLNEKSWNEIYEYLSFEFQRKDNLDQQQALSIQPFKNPKDQIYTIQWLKKNQIFLYKQKIQLIVKKSQRQSHLTNVLSILKSYICSLSLQFTTKKRQLTLLGQNSIVFQELSEHLNSLLEIFNHQYSDSLKKQTKSLVKHYEYVIQILQSYKDFGLNWQKYELLFDPSNHYTKLLSKQSKDFSNLQATWKKMIKNITMQNWSKKIYDETCGSNPNKNTLKSVHKANACWQQIKKGIEQFLDRRRNIFHQYFYFSDDELLLLMTKSQNSSNMGVVINSILPMIYDNISQINLDRDSDGISQVLASVVSIDGQQLKINKLITSKMVSQCEQLLKICQESWKKSLISNIKRIVSDFINLNEEQVPRRKIILQNITQVVLAFEHIIWVKLAQDTYFYHEPVGTLRQWISIQNDQINDIYSLIKDGTGQLEMKKISQILIQAVYLRDKTQTLNQLNIRTQKSYEWERTLKMYDHERIEIKAFGSTILYGGEFLGSTTPLYITPETEKSYINLMQLINDRQIGVFSTSTHNKESIKSFSQFVAQNFKVFTFCQGVNHRIIDRVFAGACFQGLWAYLSPPCDWDTISFMASHLSAVQKCISQNIFNIQLSKYSITISQNNLPTFFFKVSQSELKYLQKFPRLNFRTLSLPVPNMKKILEINCLDSEKSQQISEVISQLTQHCQQLFSQNLYDQFKINFALRVLRQFKQKTGWSSTEQIGNKVGDIIYRLLSSRLKQEDQLLLKNLLHVYNLQFDQQKQKHKKHPTGVYPQHLCLLQNERSPEKYGDLLIKDASVLYQILKQKQNRNKMVIVAGPSFCGKSAVIDFVKNHIQEKENKVIKTHHVYFQAFQDCDLMPINEKSGIVLQCLQQKCQNWIVFDGPLNDKCNRLFTKLSNQIVLPNYGVFKDGQVERKVKFFIETTNLSKVAPDFVNYNCILHIEQSSKRIQQIIRGALTNFTHQIYEQQIRTQTKGDENNQHEVKSYRAKKRQIQLLKQSMQILMTSMISLVERFCSKGSMKIKSIEIVYEMTSAQLAYRSAKLIQCVFIENWNTIKQKTNRKNIEKLAVWAVMWTIFTIINPEDKQKLIKHVAQMMKSNIYDEILDSIVFPGSGLEIYSLNSQRVQSALSCIPSLGNITNIVNRYNSLFDGQTINKNKFELQFYFDEPNRIRVVTPQAALFTYFTLLNRHSHMPIAIYGPPTSGKKSIIDIFNKNNQQNTESYSIRFKKHDPYFLSKQIQKPFIKFSGINKIFLKPNDISKRVHISIDDVSMGPLFEPSTEIIRMISNTQSTYDEKFNLVQFRQFILSMTINQIKSHNLEGIDFRRVLSRLFLLQTQKVTKERLSTIFTPILQNLCYEFWSGQNSQKAKAFTNKNDENVIVNATISIYSFMDDLASKLPCLSVQDRNKKILLSPKIQQICHVITNMCQIQECSNLQMSFYAQLWAHEVLRVFSDKLDNDKDTNSLFEQIKKYSFMEFKHSLLTPSLSLVFTNLCPKQVGEQKQIKYPYEKCQDLGDIQKQIQQIYDKESTSLSAPLITDQFIYQLMKVYRVLKMPAGHLLFVTPLKKSGKFLIKIACFLTKYCIYHDLQEGNLDFDMHIGPSILKDSHSCLILDIDTATRDTLYQLTCLMNRNICEFDMSQQIRQKIKLKFITIAQQSLSKQAESIQASTNQISKMKASLANDMQDNQKLIQIQNRIQSQFMQIVIECYNEYMHVFSCIHPNKIETTKFLSQNMSLAKNMHVLWHQFKDQSLYTIGERMMDQLYDSADSKTTNQQLISKCKKIYELLSHDQKSDADFLKYLGNCSKTYEITIQQIKQKISQYSHCLEVVNNNAVKIQEQRSKSKQIQQKIEQLVKKQEDLSSLIKKSQQKGDEGLEKLQEEMKKIKGQKDVLDQKSRESRTSEKIYEDFCKNLPTKQQLQQKLKKSQEIKVKSQQYAILVQSALFYLNNTDEQQYIKQFNKWMAVFELESATSIQQVIGIFQKVYGLEYIKVPGWQRQSTFTQLKGFHFCQNFMSIPESVFGTEPIVVNDQQQVLVRLLSNLSDKNPFINLYSACKLTKFINLKQSEMKKEQNYRSLRNEAFFLVEKQIEKSISESKSQLKQQMKNDEKLVFNKGIIVLGNYGKWKPARNDVDILERKMLRQKKIMTENRIIILGKQSPNITFIASKNDLKTKLVKKSMQIQFGEGSVNECNKSESMLRQLAIKQERRKQEIVKICTSEQSAQKTLELIQKIQIELNQYQKNRRKLLSIIEGRDKPTDMFLIQWVISQLEHHKLPQFDRIVEIYEFIKKCFMQLNCGREQSISSIQQIQVDIVKNWKNLISANLIDNCKIQLGDLIKFLMPIQQTPNLIVIQHKKNIQKQVKQLLKNCNYEIHYNDLHLSSHLNFSQSPLPEVDTKKIWIFENYVVQNSQHLVSFLEHYEKNKSTYCPTTIIIANNPGLLSQSKQLRQKFRIIVSQIQPKLASLDDLLSHFGQKQCKKAMLLQTKREMKKVIDQSGGSNTELSQINPASQQQMSKCKQGIKEFLVIASSYFKKQKYELFNKIPFKMISQRIDLVKTPQQSKVFLKDVLFHLPQSFQSIIDLLVLRKGIEKQGALKLTEKYLQDIQQSYEYQFISNSVQKEGSIIQNKLRVENPSIEDIEDILNQLPFGFNSQDFAETTEPFSLWMISRANKFNQKKFKYKKYLQECLKILKGNQLNYWRTGKEFGFELPSKNDIFKLNSDYKIIKKGLQLAGITNSIQASSKQIKLTASQGGQSQGQPILNLISQCFDFKSLEGFSQKLMMIAKIRASKKLKIPLSKLKLSWKLISSDILIEEPVVGENCMSLNAQISNPQLIMLKKSLIAKQNEKVKLLLMLYDPTPPLLQIQQAPKVQLKKQKLRKPKLEQKKLQTIQNQQAMIQIPIKMQNWKIIGSILMPYSEENKYKIILEQPFFMLN